MPTKKITKLNPKGTLISRVVVVKGTPGKDGKTPIAGEDYKIPDRGEDGYTPIKGVDYFDGEDGYTPTTDDLLALILPNIPNPIPGKDGKDGIDGENVPEEKIYEMVEKVVGTIEVPTIEIGEDRNGQWIEKDGKKTYIKSVTNIGAGMSTGVVDFIALRDTPSSYVGQAGKVAAVNAGETGLEFIAGGGGGAVDSVNGQTGVVVLDTDDISEGTNKYNVSHTGDATGATTLTLATVNANVGSFTNANITVNAKGLITAASNGSAGGGATAALDNLASVAINAALVLGTTDAFALGSTTKQWSDLFLAEGGVINWDNGDVTLTQTGNVLAVAGGDLRVATADVGTNADSVPTLSSTSTLTNKRVTKRVVSTTQSATPSINTDNGDIFEIVGLAQAITSMTTNLTGTPVEGQMFQVIIKDNGTARAITWGASFVSTSNAPLPTTTVISTPISIILQYRTSAVWTASSAWYCMSVT